MADPESASDHRISPRLIHVAPLLIGVLIAARASEPIRDNSFLWHIRAGTHQLDLGRVLTEDPFSFTALGEAWRTQSWLLELGYGWAERTWMSLAWANWLVFIAGIATFLLVGVATYRRARSPLVVAAASIVGVWLFAPFAQARPVVVSYVLLAAVAAVLTRHDRLAWTLPGLFWVFASVHGSWVLAGGLVILVLIQTRSRMLLAAGVASLGATALTAHGLGAWQVLVDFARNQDALALIQEWMPPDLADIAQLPYLLIVAGIVVGATRGRITPTDLIVVLPFLLYGFTSQRAVFPAAIVLLPYAASALPTPSTSTAGVSRLVVGTTMAVLVVLALLPMLTRELGVLDGERFPDATVVAAVSGSTTYHGTATGGYLIYAVWPDDPVFIDDRAELYGFDRLDASRRANLGDYEAVFGEYGIDAAILEDALPLVARLEDAGWREVARSEAHVALLAP